MIAQVALILGLLISQTFCLLSAAYDTVPRNLVTFM